MIEAEIIKRKIKLKNQAIRLIRAEKKVLMQRLDLVKLKDTLEAQIGEPFDPELSRKLDCINYLLDNRK